MSTVKTHPKKDTKSNREVITFAEKPGFENIVFDSNSISFKLSDNRIITIPLAWIPKLESSHKAVREDYILRGLSLSGKALMRSLVFRICSMVLSYRNK